MKPGKRRVAITGVGIVSALGAGREATFRRLAAGDVGIAPLTLFELGEQRSRLAAEVRDLGSIELPGSDPTWSRTDRLAMVAALEALDHSGVDLRDRISIAVGGTTGGMLEAEELLGAQPGPLPDDCVRRLLGYPLSTTATRLSAHVGGAERAVTLCSACSSGANAVALGACWVESGRADIALVGGTDGLCRLTYMGFNALGVMSPEPCRPFDRSRTGLTLGEGAAFLVLEPEERVLERGGNVVAWVTGWSVGAEAHHVTHPEPSAATSVRLMRAALDRAGLSPADVDYVNAHGTGTAQNDAVEASALARVFGEELARVPVSSSKGQVGHTLGAAGAMEAALAALCCERGMVLPTGGLREPDESLGLRHVVGRAQKLPVRAALSSSFGFGGAGTVLVVERSDAADRSAPVVASPVVVTGLLLQSSAGELAGEDAAGVLSGASSTRAPEVPLLERLEPARSRRFDRASALVTLGAERLLRDAALEPREVGLVGGSAFGNLERSVEFLRRAFERGARFASPAEFPHLVPSAAAGNASIYLGLTGPVLTVSDVANDTEVALHVASSFIESGLAQAIVAGSAEPRDGAVEQMLAPLRGLPDADDARGEGGAWLLLESAAAAERRGARPLARILANIERARPVDLPAPANVPSAVVVSTAPEAWVRAWLDGSPWQAVAFLGLTLQGIPAEVRSGHALGAAVALLAAGEHDEALVLANRDGQWRALRLGSAVGPGLAP